MNTIKDGIIGVSGIVLTGISMENLTAWVSLICSLAIAIVTCGIQIYRMIRDRDTDKEEKKEEQKNDSELH